MKLTFEDTVTTKLRNGTPSTGGNLLGFDIDLFYALDHSGYFSHIKTQRTGDQRNMIVATCRLKSKYKNILPFPETLIKIWQEDIAYSYFEAHEVHMEVQYMILRFVTTATYSDLCVTGTIRVAGVLPK